ncbi:transcription initiation factor TFIID subunit 4-like [Rhinopithecus roxellana]|uniref:transcription initiation factor TFIID subunit 4-like n=1 Tax=Rhinopithecus roxellana TaxID=61622 RepID=UPI0012376383|nr:transcription initiation factor TFIID subunit 4-like [Rhinopithecus roxellana]
MLQKASKRLLPPQGLFHTFAIAPRSLLTGTLRARKALAGEVGALAASPLRGLPAEQQLRPPHHGGGRAGKPGRASRACPLPPLPLLGGGGGGRSGSARHCRCYFSPGAAATRRPPAGRPARPAAGTLPPPAPGLGPRRIRPASGGGPRPGPAKPPPRGCAGRTRPQASWRAWEGGAALPRAPGFRPPSLPGALGAAAFSPPWNPGPGLPAAREREARESAPGPGAGGGRAARDRSRGSLLAPSALPGSRPRAGGAAGPGWGAGAAVFCGRGGWLFGRPPKLPSCRVVWGCYPVEMCPRRGHGSSCSWGGGPLGDGEGEWHAPPKELNLLLLERQGL